MKRIFVMTVMCLGCFLLSQCELIDSYKTLQHMDTRMDGTRELNAVLHIKNERADTIRVKILAHIGRLNSDSLFLKINPQATLHHTWVKPKEVGAGGYGSLELRVLNDTIKPLSFGYYDYGFGGHNTFSFTVQSTTVKRY